MLKFRIDRRIILYNVALYFKCVGKILKCDHSNESYWEVLSCVVVFIILYKEVPTFESVEKYESMAIQMKAIEQYFPVVLFIMPSKVVPTFESVDEILKCDHSNESYWAVLSCGAVYYAVQGGSNFWICGWNPKVWLFKWRLLNSTFLWCCLLCREGGSSCRWVYQ